MLYKKYMVIMTGSGGKATLTAERTANGCNFSFKSFSLPEGAVRTLGVITKNGVIIRGLGKGKSPAISFTADADIESIHCAVVENQGVILYGNNGGQRMWDANILSAILPKTEFSFSKTIEAPKSDRSALSMPPGYNDEQISTNNIYSGFIYNADSKRVNDFLDAPRSLLDESIAPKIMSKKGDEGQEMDNEDRKFTKDLLLELIVKMREQGELDDGSANKIGQILSGTEPQASIETQPAAQGGQAQAPLKEAAAPEIDRSAPQAEKPELDAMREIKNTSAAEENAVLPEKSNAVPPVADGRAQWAERPKDSASEGSAQWAQKPELDAMREAAAAAAPSELERTYLSEFVNGKNRVLKPLRADIPKTAGDAQIPQIRRLTFYEMHGDDIKQLFETAPKDERLNKLMPDALWVRAEIEGTGAHIVVGQFGRDYICYGIPARFTSPPPDGFEDAHWLPLDPKDPSGDGYWLLFQNAKTGESAAGVIV